jgi:hypothetical protein
MVSIPRKEGVFNNQEVYLVDSLTGVQHNLSQSNYTFTTSQVITEGRFKLVFTTNYSNTTNKTDSANNLLCIFNENGLYLHSNNQNIKDVEVYDLQVIKSTGYLVKKQKDINNNTTQIPVANNHKLITVKITLQDGSQVVKKLAR